MSSCISHGAYMRISRYPSWGPCRFVVSCHLGTARTFRGSQFEVKWAYCSGISGAFSGHPYSHHFPSPPQILSVMEPSLHLHYLAGCQLSLHLHYLADCPGGGLKRVAFRLSAPPAPEPGLSRLTEDDGPADRSDDRLDGPAESGSGWAVCGGPTSERETLRAALPVWGDGVCRHRVAFSVGG